MTAMLQLKKISPLEPQGATAAELPKNVTLVFLVTRKVM
jgi:hypothetical protein